MWTAKGYPTVSGPREAVPATTFKANYQPKFHRTMEQMKENLTSKREQVCMRTHPCMQSHILKGIEAGGGEGYSCMEEGAGGGEGSY